MSRVMLLVLLVTFTGLVLEVVGQTEFYSNGTSGPTCGKAKRHCLSDAKCNRGIAFCQCKRPLIGNGKLFCSRPGDGVAILQMDPILKTFSGENLHVPIPCRYKVVHYTKAAPKGVKTSAEVYAKNVLSKNGDYYVESVLIVISVMMKTKVGKHIVRLEGSRVDGEFKYVATTLDDSMIKPSLMLQKDFYKYTVDVSVDQRDNFIIATCPGMGLTVGFRPPSRPLVGPQTMVSGVTMVIDKDVIDSVTFVNETLAYSPQGQSVVSQARSMGMDTEQYAHFLALYTTPPIMMDDTLCQDTSLIFKNLCKNDSVRINMLEKCSPLYTDKTFLSCIYKEREWDGHFFAHKVYFRSCAQYFCLERVDMCQAMMQRIKATKCPLPLKMRDLQCSAEALKLRD